MSKITKRKHVTKEVVDDYYVPEGDESIVKVTGGRGNNLHEVRSADGVHFLVSMPNKFRKNVWIKRGDYVIIDSIKEGNKVRGEIVYVLYQKQIKYLQLEGYWPAEFNEGSEAKPVDTPAMNGNVSKNSLESASEDEESEEDEELFRNPNHRPVVEYSDDSSEKEDDDGDGDEVDHYKDDDVDDGDKYGDDADGVDNDEDDAEVGSADSQASVVDAVKAENNNIGNIQLNNLPLGNLQIAA